MDSQVQSPKIPKSNNQRIMDNEHQNIKNLVINSFDNTLIKAYCTIRFRIMNMRILEEVGQYLPEDGHILDIGCGFG
ncbi:MAG: hypothetical protein AAFV53_11950, partial [Myxococcota bacterium]